MKKNDLFLYAFIFLSTFLVLQYFQGGPKSDPVLDQSQIGMKVLKDDYAIGGNVQLEIKNNGTETLTIPSKCPDAPLEVYKYSGTGFVEIMPSLNLDCEKSKDLAIEPGKSTTISYSEYAFDLFGEIGRYKIGYKEYSSQEFEIGEPSVFTKFGRTFLYQPILNLMILILTYVPGNYLGIAIIILTIIIRTILLVPSQKAMRAQKRLMEVQPKLEELKKKYAGDQQRLAQETMMVWKTHKVNPLSSCLPILIQIPILIALYHVIQSGLNPDRAVFIYSFMPPFDFADINSYFLGLNLLEKSLIILPIIVGALQFLQMKLAMAAGKKNNPNASQPKELEMTNKMMTYFMPVMIMVFTASLPAAVGLYWGTSTLYGILQQLVVNKEGPAPKNADEEVKVRVINKNN